MERCSVVTMGPVVYLGFCQLTTGSRTISRQAKKSRTNRGAQVFFYMKKKKNSRAAIADMKTHISNPIIVILCFETRHQPPLRNRQLAITVEMIKISQRSIVPFFAPG